ncbi:MAG TPA: isochorismatase family protein [Opitutaceae bacterium]|nr:isochorismatase family protein [Opitutaceae bacterium]
MKPASPPKGALLLCLDLQPVFLRAVADGGRILGRCRFAVASARGLGMRVAFTEQAPGKLGTTDPSLLALVERPDVHAKEAFSALAPGSPALAGLLAGGGTEHLLLCGVETPVCVYQTALDALQAGLAVTVLADCVGARREGDARLCLDALARAGVHVLPAETVFYSIIAGASHPFFKSYTELVKKHA